ncbi:hypothetical protein EVAR_11353_1 [Eumeta japonica]|uniref:Uncharacterized protein n=1 Tax=Eumeta variegata TaxID=151549 RepID=A0A4C1U0S5_EUMVA|nr:hypothetical protein EVAR_11353_1 [Eumeta japonica]
MTIGVGPFITASAGAGVLTSFNQKRCLVECASGWKGKRAFEPPERRRSSPPMDIRNKPQRSYLCVVALLGNITYLMEGKLTEGYYDDEGAVG